MTKKVLIIGGSGFLGKNIIRRCIKNNWKVFATHHKNKPKDNSFESFFFDLSKPKIPKKFNIKFDYVFFCAGEIDHSDQNYNKVLNEHFYSLLKITKKLKTKNFYYFSTADEYKKSNKMLIENLSETSFKTFYSLAKYLAGQYLMTLHRKKIFNLIIFRIFIVYGPEQNKNRLIPGIISKLLSNKKFTILNSHLKKDFIFIDDFINAIFLIIKKTNFSGNIVNIGSGKSVSLKYLGQLVYKKIKRGKISFKNLRTTDSYSQFASIEILENKFKWKQKISLKQGLCKTIEYFRNETN